MTAPARPVLDPAQAEMGLVVRVARKDWRCQSWALADGVDRLGRQNRTYCRRTIPAGSLYLEYLGESGAWESGLRYCPAHAWLDWDVDLVGVGACSSCEVEVALVELDAAGRCRGCQP